MGMVPSKGRLSGMLVLIALRFGHSKGRDTKIHGCLHEALGIDARTECFRDIEDRRRKEGLEDFTAEL